MNRMVSYILASSVVVALDGVAMGDITVRFETPNATVGVGETASFDILADIPLGEPVIGWGLDLIIDDGSIASAFGVPVINNAIWNPAFASDGDGLAGIVPFLDPGISGDGVLLATVTLSADSIGQTDLFLGVTAGDFTEGFALDPFGFADLQFESGQLTVIPAPGAAVLALIGLPMVRWAARRSRVTRI